MSAKASLLSRTLIPEKMGECRVVLSGSALRDGLPDRIHNDPKRTLAPLPGGPFRVLL